MIEIPNKSMHDISSRLNASQENFILIRATKKSRFESSNEQQFNMMNRNSKYSAYALNPKHELTMYTVYTSALIM